MADYPEHEKLAKVRDASQSIGEFLEWAQERGWNLAEWRTDLTVEVDCSVSFTQKDYCVSEDSIRDHEPCGGTGRRTVKANDALLPIQPGLTDVLATYFDIDQNVLEAEKRTMLDAQRALNDA